ncbi:MAG: hypothetical protein V1645_01100 [archaeon]
MDKDHFRKKKKIHFIDLVRPETLNPYKSHIGPQEAFGVFQWMVKEGEEVRGLYEALSGKPTCINSSGADPFSSNWRREVTEGFRCLLLSSYCSRETEEWKMKKGISITESKIIPFSHYAPQTYVWMSNSDLVRLIDDTFKIKDKVTVEKYNECHPRATTAYNLKLRVESTRFSLDLVYGYARDRGSAWENKFTSEEGESFLDFIQRAREHYQQTLRQK